MTDRKLPVIMGRMTAIPPSLGTRIRRARERARLSQEELARAVGASVRAVGDWENDRRLPRNRIGALEDVLGVGLTEDLPPPSLVPREIAEAVRRAPDLTEGDRARVMEAIERTLAGEPRPPTEPGGAAPASGERGEPRQRAGLGPR